MVNDPTQFLPRRTKSSHAEDKAVDDFTRVVEQTGILKGPSAFDVAMTDFRRKKDRAPIKERGQV